MFEFLETLVPENEEHLPDNRVDKIKTSVLSRIEEDKPMKKHFTIKPLLIAAAITATGAISALSAGAVTTPAVSDETLPAATDTPAAPENDPKPDTTSKPADSAVERIEMAPPEILDGDKKGTVSAVIIQPVGTELDYEVSEQKISDMELIGVDADGTRHYKTAAGETVSLRLINADEEDVTVYYCFERFIPFSNE